MVRCGRRIILAQCPAGRRGPALTGVLTPAMVDGMRQHKPGLHALVEDWSERAALMEYDGRLPRDEAERLAWVCIQSARDVCTV